jgi:hypothetical protein
VFTGTCTTQGVKLDLVHGLSDLVRGHEVERPRSVSLPDRRPACGCDVARDLPHLPTIKQRQLCAVVGIIRGMAEVERVILYGSHARGDWVADPAGGYVSDLDILVLVGSSAFAADEALWADCQDRAQEVAGDTPGSLIVHTVGVALYDAGRVAITVPELTPAMHYVLAEACFQHYFERAAQLYRSFERNLAHGSLAIAAFEIHQVAETISKAVLVVFTAYLPRCMTSTSSAADARGPVRTWGPLFRTMRQTVSA